MSQRRWSAMSSTLATTVSTTTKKRLVNSGLMEITYVNGVYPIPGPRFFPPKRSTTPGGLEQVIRTALNAPTVAIFVERRST